MIMKNSASSSLSRTTISFSTQYLVRSTAGSCDGVENVDDRSEIFPILSSNVPLSFWGGIDETTGIVIDTSHPLHGQCVKDTILCLPSGRGSCTASQVLLELILNHKAPKAIVLRDRDGLVCVGAIIAQIVFPEETSNVPNIVQLDPI